MSTDLPMRPVRPAHLGLRPLQQAASNQPPETTHNPQLETCISQPFRVVQLKAEPTELTELTDKIKPTIPYLHSIQTTYIVDPSLETDERDSHILRFNTIHFFLEDSKLIEQKVQSTFKCCLVKSSVQQHQQFLHPRINPEPENSRYRLRIPSKFLPEDTLTKNLPIDCNLRKLSINDAHALSDKSFDSAVYIKDINGTDNSKLLEADSQKEYIVEFNFIPDLYKAKRIAEFFADRLGLYFEYKVTSRSHCIIA